MHKTDIIKFDTKAFLSSVVEMSMEEVGEYITLLCIQCQNGFITEKRMQRSALVIREKFVNDGENRYKNLVMEAAIIKELNYIASRRKSGSYGGRGNKKIAPNLDQKNDESVRKAYASNNIDIISLNKEQEKNIPKAHALRTLLDQKQKKKIISAVKRLDEAGRINLAEIESKFFADKGTVFVIEKFVEYFELAGYVFVSDNATLTFYQGWINRLSISKISGKIQQEVVLTPEIASQISKLEDLARQDLIIFNFLDKEPKENRSSLTGLLIEEFGFKDLVKKIFWYADFGSGGGKGSLKHFKESLKNYSDKDMDFDAIFKKRNIEI